MSLKQCPLPPFSYPAMPALLVAAAAVGNLWQLLIKFSCPRKMFFSFHLRFCLQQRLLHNMPRCLSLSLLVHWEKFH